MTAALDFMAGLVLEDGRPWGAAADRVQLDDARAVLEPGDGPRRHWIGRPRGYAKTFDLGGMRTAELVTGAIWVCQLVLAPL